MWAYGQEKVGRERQVWLQMMLVASATAFGSDQSQKMYGDLFHQLVGEQTQDKYNVNELSDKAKLVLFGSNLGEGGE